MNTTNHAEKQCDERTAIPKRPRRERTIRLARQFIVRAGIRSLPVLPFALFERHGWLVHCRKDAGQIYGKPDPFGLLRARADARTVRCRATGIYVTVFRKSSRRSSRVRWTLAHEIGHIFLGHLTDFKATLRCSLKARDYRTLEREADLFAAELLMPMAIIRALGAWSVDAIMHACKVSRQAAQHRILDFCKWGDTPIALEDDKVLREHFGAYLHTRQLNTGEVMPVEHKAILTNEIGRFLTCPQCGNNDFSTKAKFCKSCGLFLFNECPNCEMVNPADARFCEYCGSETFLMHKQLLPNLGEKTRPKYGRPPAVLSGRG